MEDQRIGPGAASSLAQASGKAFGLSLSQHEVWLDQMAWPQSAHLNIGGGAFLHGRFDISLLKAALQALVDENQALRLVPDYSGNQVLLQHYEPELEIVDFCTSDNPQEEMRSWWNTRIRRPIPLGDKPPWRFSLLRGNEDLHGLTIQFHHLVMDGWGTSLVMQRWSQIYGFFAAGQTGVPATPNLATYEDFVEDSQRYRDSNVFSTDRNFWRAALPALPPPLVERQAGPVGQSGLPDAYLSVKRVDRADYDAIAILAKREGLTVFNLFLAALAIYFSRTCGQGEIVIGVPSLNRNGRKFRETMGMFVGVTAVPVKIPANISARDLLAQIGAFMRSALRHARYPLSELARGFDLARQARSSLFDLLLSFERQDYELSFGNASLRNSRQLFAGKARYPLGVTVCEFHADEDVEIVIEASAEAFAASDAKYLADRLWHLVTTIARTPDSDIRTLAIVPDAELAQIRRFSEGKLQPLPRPASFIAHFMRRATSHPAAAAVTWEGGQISYGALAAIAGQIGEALIQQGIGKGQVVAFAIERSPEMIQAMLGISLAGSAFLPLDPDAPLNRNAEILQESRAAALLLAARDCMRFKDLPVRVCVVEQLSGAPAHRAPAEPMSPDPDDPAYVLFTSGSTGKPKGVVVDHGALVRRLTWLAEHWDITPTDRSVQATQITFDPSLIEVCLPLMCGASIALPPPGKVLPESLPVLASRLGGNFLAFVPSTLTRFLLGVPAADGLRLKVACCGGEVLAPELAANFHRITGARLFNLYGPTEATIFATAQEWTGVSDSITGHASLSIGYPVDDTCVQILDGNMLPLPFGASGEIYIGGSALAKGYLHRPDLTQSAFIHSPSSPSVRLYRTGDRGFLDAAGAVHFRGRIDRQVKLRGYRIEPAEIELALTAQEGVSRAAVKLIDHEGRRQLHAWVVAEQNVRVEHLQAQLLARLPSYMVPSSIQRLTSMPESAVGKIDYPALPNPAEQVVAKERRRPAGEMESRLLALWCDVLGNPQLSVNDNFFDAGGDSLAAINILAGIEKFIGRRVPMYLLSERPTVAGLAAALSEESASPGLMLNLSADDTAHVGPSPAVSSRAVVYLAASGHGDLLRFQTLARALADTCEIRMLQPPSASTIARTVDLAELYADLVSRPPVAPCFLAGFSVGGLAALETARLAVLRGVQVEALFLLDTIFPSRLWGGTFLWRALRWLVGALHIQDLNMNGRRLGAMLNDPGLFGQVMAVSGYRVKPFPGVTHLVKSVGLAGRWDRLLFSGWRQQMGKQLVEHRVKGMHGSMFEPQNVDDLANVIRVATRASSRG